MTIAAGSRIVLKLEWAAFDRRIAWRREKQAVGGRRGRRTGSVNRREGLEAMATRPVHR